MKKYLIVDKFDKDCVFSGLYSDKNRAITRVKEIVTNEVKAGKRVVLDIIDKWILNETECLKEYYGYNNEITFTIIYYCQLVGDRIFYIVEIEEDVDLDVIIGDKYVE